MKQLITALIFTFSCTAIASDYLGTGPEYLGTGPEYLGTGPEYLAGSTTVSSSHKSIATKANTSGKSNRIFSSEGRTYKKVDGGVIDLQTGEFIPKGGKSRHPDILIDSQTGQAIPRTGAVYTDPRDGKVYQPVAGGVIDTRTGKFHPTN